jgi:hypothetical protein
MTKLHENPQHFVQVVENALHRMLWDVRVNRKYDEWNRVYKFYEARYKAPDAPYKHLMLEHGWQAAQKKPSKPESCVYCKCTKDTHPGWDRDYPRVPCWNCKNYHDTITQRSTPETPGSRYRDS